MILVVILPMTGSAYGPPAEDSISGENVIAEIEKPKGEEVHPAAEYFEWILYRLGKLPLVLVILYGITILSIITMLILLVFILLNRNRLEREAKTRAYLLEEYQRLLMDFLFDDGEGEETYRELDRVARSSLHRQILIDQIIDIMVNLKGNIKQKAKGLYLSLGLKKDSMRKARSRKWHKKIKGYRELAFMNIRDANEQIVRSLNSNNEILRMEAQIALVRLSDENPFEWLHRLERPLSLWEQITLVELLTQHEMPVPEFKQWFHSQNISVLIFALEMITRFEQGEAEKEVVAMFDHGLEKVRRTAFRVSGDMKFSSSLGAMQKLYRDEPYDNRMEILKSFANNPDENYLGFLKTVLDEEEDVQLQIQATKAMENTDEPGISMLVKLMKSKAEYKNYQIIIRHVLDGRIY